jgi:hypothetical protein
MDPRLPCRVFALVLAGAAAPGLAGSQDSSSSAPSASALVVDIPGDALYHQPGCPLVAKAGSNVKVMRLAEANRRGMKAHNCREAAGTAGDEGPDAATANAVPVYTQDGDRRYHTDGCEQLKKAPQKVPLDKAGRSHFPCPVCKPPIRQRPGK